MITSIFSHKSIYRSLFFLLLIWTMLLDMGRISTARAQDTATETSTFGPTETPLPLAHKFISPQTSDLTKDSATDQIILKYKSTTSAFFAPEQAAQINRLSNVANITLKYFRNMSGDAIVLSLPKRLPVEQVWKISEKLTSLPEVEYAVPDQIAEIAITPNDPLYPKQWHYYENWGINAPAAWDITTGSSSIVVAIIDTGITNHVDLSGRTVQGYDFITNVWKANDNDGRDSNPSDPGDWVAAGDCGTNEPARRSSWHGTLMAGLIGAKSNNNDSVGVAGINWNSKILPVRVLGRCGGYDSDVIDGMRWAAGLPVTGVPANSNPAKVLNMSLTYKGVCSSAYSTAIHDITSAGVVVVVAAGNRAEDANGYVPANCSDVITVAATNRSGDRAQTASWGSNFGSTIEISAPGGTIDFTNDPNGVYSTGNTGTTTLGSDTYVYANGTSMAAPHVSGVVSLMFSLNPYLDPSQVLQILQDTARAFPVGSSCNTSICGKGVVNAGAALKAVPPTTPAIISPVDKTIVVYPQNVTFDWSDSGNSYTFYFTGYPSDTQYDTTTSSTTVSNPLAGFYEWFVIAHRNGQDSGPSAFTDLYIVPSAPGNVTVTTNSRSSVTVNWTTSLGGVDEYKVYRNGTYIATVDANTYSYVVTGLPCGSTATYSVRAYRGPGIHNESPEGSANGSTSSCLPGDANGDGNVNGNDYVIWLNHYGQSVTRGPSDGDFNKDGYVNGVDYSIWLNNYGK